MNREREDSEKDSIDEDPRSGCGRSLASCEPLLVVVEGESWAATGKGTPARNADRWLQAIAEVVVEGVELPRTPTDVARCWEREVFNGPGGLTGVPFHDVLGQPSVESKVRAEERERRARFTRLLWSQENPGARQYPEGPSEQERDRAAPNVCTVPGGCSRDVLVAVML